MRNHRDIKLVTSEKRRKLKIFRPFNVNRNKKDKSKKD